MMSNIREILARRLSPELAAKADINERTIIRLNGSEIQSGLNRVRWAEGLIRQLPEKHDGRNSWLMRYAEHTPDGKPSPTTDQVRG